MAGGAKAKMSTWFSKPSNESFWALHSILSFCKQKVLNFESEDEILSYNRAATMKHKKDHGTDIFFTVLKIFE